MFCQDKRQSDLCSEGQNKNTTSRHVQRCFLLEATKLLTREHTSDKPGQCLHLEEDMAEAHTPQVEEEQVISIKINLVRSLRVRRHFKIVPAALAQPSKRATALRQPSAWSITSARHNDIL